jgi:hypothetical protein
VAQHLLDASSSRQQHGAGVAAFSNFQQGEKFSNAVDLTPRARMPTIRSRFLRAPLWW